MRPRPGDAIPFWAQNPLLQDLGRTVSVAAGQKRDDLGSGGQAARDPEHTHRHDRPILVGVQLLSLAVMRYVLEAEKIVALRAEQAVFSAADVCQRYLTERL